jgi:hypothetical protein
MPINIDMINDFFMDKGIVPMEIRISDVEIMKGEAGRRNKYNFRDMEIGETKVLCDSYSRYKHQKYGNAPRNWAKKSPDCKHYRFRTYKTEDGKIATKRIK